MVKASTIVGTWLLEKYKVTLEDGRDYRLWGEDAQGVIIYLDNGYMSVHVSRVDVPQFESNDFLRGTEAEVRASFEGYTTYYGKYNYDEENSVVYHEVIRALYPNWCGVTHTRYATITDRQLILRTTTINIDGVGGVMEMFWRKQ